MRHASAITTTRTTAALLGLTGMLALSACGNQGGDAAAPASPPAGAETVTTAPADGGTATTDAETTGAATMDTTSPAATEQMSAAAFTATLQNADGGEVGTVEVHEAEGAMELRVEAMDMEPGFYGLHVHAIGECEPDSANPSNPDETGAFLSAGSHIGAEDSEHPDHAGDLPALLVLESGDAHLTFHTDRLTAENFTDEDGAAMMVHSNPDNYANIPERYAPEGPDEDTLATGDAGDRLACGVIEAAG